jgi:glycosyltransferase involved in cell wall biosynthesis
VKSPQLSGNAMTGEAVGGLVSTIIPVRNRPGLLGEAVASVLAQTYRPIEIIIVDDGSTDDTLAVAESIAANSPGEIRVMHQRNAGPGLAREAGRRVAKGEFIQYLDSDDVLLPDKFRLQTTGLRDAPSCGAAYGYTRYRHADGHVEPQPWKGSGTRVETMFPSLLKSRWWDTPTPLYRASLCEAAGPWSDLRLEEDWEYDCRIAALGVHLYFCEAYVAEVRDHGQGRLCYGEVLDPVRLSQRAQSHKLILEHARRAGIGHDAPEMQHFARELFLLARQCGAAGLARESRDLFLLSKAASGKDRATGLDFRFYGIAAGVLGWPLVGRIACATDRLRK